MNYPKVAIIILNYTGWKDTIECLESVLRNDYPNYQVIVVDNGSPNNSMEYIKAWAEGRQEVLTPEPGHPLYNLSHPPVKKPISYIYYTREEAEKGGDFKLEERITEGWQKQRKFFNNKELISTSLYPLIFIQTGENLGFAGGNNVGIRYALKQRAEYVLILNNDTQVEKNILLAMVEAAQENEAGVVGAVIKDANTKNILFIKSFYPYMFFYSEPQRSIPKNKWWLTHQVNGSAMLLHKDLLIERYRELGYFLDASLFLYCEEIELAMWCLQKKIKSIIAGEAIVYHKVGTSSGGRGKPIQFYYLTRNRVLLAHRYLGGLFRILFAASYLFWRIIRAGMYITQGRWEVSRAILQGLLDGYRKKIGPRL